MTNTTLTAERAAQCTDILRAFAFHGITVSSIEWDDDAETISVYAPLATYRFEIGSDDDALVFVNTAEAHDVVTVALPAE